MKFNTKNVTIIGCSYGCIVAGANVIGSQIPSTFSPLLVEVGAFSQALATFQEKFAMLNIVINILSYLIPLILCVSYTNTKDEEIFKSRFINIPFAYSIRGITGWLFYFIFEAILLLFVNKKFHLPISGVFLSSFCYFLMQSLFSFAIAFFIMETVHRRYVLPKFFPDGNLHQYKGLRNISLRGLFTIFYLSTGIFPVLYILFAYLSNIKNNGSYVDKRFFIFLIFIMIISVVITVIFTAYFSRPLGKMMKATEIIKEGAFGHKVHIVCNDSFGDLADTFNAMSDSLKEKSEKVENMQNSIIEGMAMMVESRDNSTGGHIMRTSSCVRIFAEALKKDPIYKGKSPEFYADVIKAAPMHDLGKIAVDDSILRKPGKYTDEEYEKMKTHSAEGARIVRSVLKEVDDIEFKQIAINVAHFHHEKWNGTGYPDKLQGEAIPFEARIMALADVFDALVSKRCYKDSFTYDKAFQIIQESLGNHFDPDLGKVFLSCRPQLEALYNDFSQAE